MLMVTVIVAETDVPFDVEQGVVCSTADAVTSSLDACNLHIAGDKSDIPTTMSLNAELDDGNDSQSVNNWLVTAFHECFSGIHGVLYNLYCTSWFALCLVSWL